MWPTILEPAVGQIESYGGHRHYHRSLTFYMDALRQHGLVVSRLYEPPERARDREHAAFYRGIPKFLLIEARHGEPPSK